METENYRRVNIPTLIPPLLPGRAERWLPPGCRRRRAGLGPAERGRGGPAGAGATPGAPSAAPPHRARTAPPPSRPQGARREVRGPGSPGQALREAAAGEAAELACSALALGTPVPARSWEGSGAPQPISAGTARQCPHLGGLARLAAPYWAAPLGSAAARRGQGAGLSRHSACKQRSSPLPPAGTRAGGLRESRARRTRCEAYPR